MTALTGCMYVCIVYHCVSRTVVLIDEMTCCLDHFQFIASCSYHFYYQPIRLHSLLIWFSFWSKSSRQIVVRPVSYPEGSSQSLCSQRKLKGITESRGKKKNAQKEYIIVFRSGLGKEEEQKG